MRRCRIEDDDDQLKVPADEVPPVRAPDVAAVVDGAPKSGAAKLLGASTPTTAPAANAPRQIPGLAFRAAAAKIPSTATSISSVADDPSDTGPS